MLTHGLFLILRIERGRVSKKRAYFCPAGVIEVLEFQLIALLRTTSVPITVSSCATSIKNTFEPKGVIMPAMHCGCTQAFSC